MDHNVICRSNFSLPLSLSLSLCECIFPAFRPHPEDVLGPVAGPAQMVEHEEPAGSHCWRRPGVDALHKSI